MCEEEGGTGPDCVRGHAMTDGLVAVLQFTESDLALTESINVQVQQSAQYKCKVIMIHVTRSY